MPVVRDGTVADGDYTTDGQKKTTTNLPKASTSPASTVRKEIGDGASPGSASGRDSINDVAEVDWIQYI